jgi:hypothetical protein
VTRPSAPLGPPTPSRARRWLVVPALLVVVLAWGLTACSGPASAQTGDCVERSGDDSYVAVDCSAAQLRVLERQEDEAGDCTTVAGVTEGYVDYTGGYRLCLGPLDTDPATAVNVADVGDCLAGVDAGSGVAEVDVHQVDCADSSAGAQVLSRSEDVLPIGFECDDVAGSMASYSWSLDETSTGDAPIAPLNMTDILFCLGPPGVDPQASPDTAQVGDCLQETGDEIGYAKLDCSAPGATYRVVERVDTGFVPVEIACASAPDAVSGVQSQGGLNGYVLCLALN